MPCLVVLLALAFPRVIIAVLYFFTEFFRGVFDSILFPVLGFLFAPLTLLAYTWLTKTGEPVGAFYIIVIAIALIIDLGLVGRGEKHRRSRT